jgi:hypothetical protein
LIVLAASNDPFYCGPTRQALAHCESSLTPVTSVIYISDFDPAGNGMPVSVARKIEHILRRDGHDDLDIRIDPLVLTAEQVERYRLPRIPIKETDARKRHFEARFGTGAVELDALEGAASRRACHARSPPQMKRSTQGRHPMSSRSSFPTHPIERTFP